MSSIFVYPGSNNMVSKKYIDSVLEKFKKDDVILLQNEISNVDYIINRAFEKGLCIILNPSINERIRIIDFDKIKYIVLNEIEICEIFGGGDVETALDNAKTKYPDLKIVLTLGEKGCGNVNSESERGYFGYWIFGGKHFEYYGRYYTEKD